MGPERVTPVTSRRAPHHRYVPSVRAEPANLPETRRAWGLYPGEPETCRRQLLPFVRTVVQLGLLLVIFKKYQIEGRAFLAVVTLAFWALPVHYLAPYAWKKPLFVAASIGGMFWVFGATVTAIVLGLASVLIGVCFLPLTWTSRTAWMALFCLILALARSQPVLDVIPSTVWPVLATIFMFRMMIYLYEVKHARAPETLIDTVSYFFLLPNFSFMHFPVVDYRTLQRGFFADDVHAIQRRGLEMMLRGTYQLLCYRLVYHELLIPAAEVHDPWTLAGYLTCNYLLYLRVSGQFHIACGMLHLFGYRLPETHHRYLLATGFTDYWRRINIYWKDFMVRLFFNPVVFRLKRWPQPLALGVATLTVFLATWMLHAYQSFWLRGSWGLSVPDAMFWGALGALVLVCVQLDARRSLSRSRQSGRRIAGNHNPGPDAGSRGSILAALLVRGLKTAGTFTTIALLWSLWSSPSLTAWLGLLHRGLWGM
jgi:alginate O-acetyltransferase complex protein AlgI